MRPPALLLALVVAGCASPDDAGAHEAGRWTYTQRSTAEDIVEMGSSGEFNVKIELAAAPNARQIGGQWHAPLAAGVPLTLRMNASVDMTVEWRVKSGETGASGRCEWGPEGAEKDLSLGVARMSNTTRSCEVAFSPRAELRDADEPTLRWEARAREEQPEGWNLAFEASR